MNFLNEWFQETSEPENVELDSEWTRLVREAMKSGVSKDEFKSFLEFNKWKMDNK
ncbi:anti-repressor SinI family protein [Ferdinandcohnia sp. Marseille-Q9671]